MNKSITNQNTSSYRWIGNFVYACPNYVILGQLEKASQYLFKYDQVWDGKMSLVN